jgi:hypothetical protein
MLAEILDEHRANTENRLELVAEILDEFSSLLSQNSRPVPEAVAG